MDYAFFPDNTVLINFHLIKRFHVLASLVRSPTWVATVRGECWNSNNYYPGLFEASCELFGNAQYPTAAQHVDIHVLRQNLADPADDHSNKHLGEAETIVIASSPPFKRSRFLTDDLDAKKAGATAGLTCFGTLDLLAAAEKVEVIAPGEARTFELQLQAKGRYPRRYYTG